MTKRGICSIPFHHRRSGLERKFSHILYKAMIVPTRLVILSVTVLIVGKWSMSIDKYVGVIKQKAKPAGDVNMYSGLKSGCIDWGLRGYQKAKKAKGITQYFHIGRFLAKKRFSWVITSQIHETATIRNMRTLPVLIAKPYSSVIAMFWSMAKRI